MLFFWFKKNKSIDNDDDDDRFCWYGDDNLMIIHLINRWLIDDDASYGYKKKNRKLIDIDNKKNRKPLSSTRSYPNWLDWFI